MSKHVLVKPRTRSIWDRGNGNREQSRACGRARKMDQSSTNTGNVIYFSLERFVRDIGLGDCCFICGASPSDVPFNNEHVIAEWFFGASACSTVP
jgi:hypothetical protein